MVIDVDVLQKNAKILVKVNSRAKEILQKTNGKRSYKDIAEILDINEKTVSPVLSLSEKLGFSEKIKAGLYKKITSNMKHIPNPKRSKKIIVKKDALHNVVKKVSVSTKKVKDIELPSKIHVPTSLTSMTEAYAFLYVAENNLRKLIRNVFGKTSTWWEQKAPKGVRDNVKEAMNNYPYDGGFRKDELEYTHLGELKDIIIKNSNWKEFKPFLEINDKEKFRVIVDKAIPTRNSIGHCIPLAGNDLKEVSVRFNDIIKMIK